MSSRTCTPSGVEAVAVANPLRSVAGDAAYVRDVIAGLDRPVLLVGHSYGGMVITEAGAENPAVVGLVYVAAFAPDQGESALSCRRAPRQHPRRGARRLPGQHRRQRVRHPARRLPRPVRGRRRPPHRRADGHGPSARSPSTPSARGCRPTSRRGRPCPVVVRLRWRGPQHPRRRAAVEAERAGARGIREVAGASHAISVSRPDEVTDEHPRGARGVHRRGRRLTIRSVPGVGCAAAHRTPRPPVPPRLEE